MYSPLAYVSPQTRQQNIEIYSFLKLETRGALIANIDIIIHVTLFPIPSDGHGECTICQKFMLATGNQEGGKLSSIRSRGVSRPSKSSISSWID